LERFVGCLVATFYTTMFFVVAIYSIICAWLIWLDPLSCLSWILAAPLLLSCLIPPFQCHSMLRLPLFRCMQKYFDFEVIAETTHEELSKLVKKRQLLHACQPHGVVSMCGLCWGVLGAHDPTYSNFKTAVASSVRYLPIVKHAIGMYGEIVDASKKSLMRALQKDSVALYIGGIAELFLSSTKEEVLYLKRRKGFIKLALQSGADVVPSYLFGNTAALSIVQNKYLAHFARKFGVSISWIYGRWGLPIPRPVKMLVVVGRPLGLPHIPSPLQEDIDKWHAVYVAEVVRIYNKYKEKHPVYREKKLVVT
ncbi:unnamed protein product, partial [Heterosigma akashiwo]